MDYCRFIVFSILRIRQICLYFEKLIFSLCNKINENKNNKNVFYYLLLMIIFISASYISYYLMFYKGIDKCKLILKKIFYNGTNSIAMLIQSISIILIFIKINYKNSIAKFILFFGRLSFSAYIIHTHLDLRYKIP